MSQDQPRRAATVLESVEDLRTQIRRAQTAAIEIPAPAPPQPQAAAAAPPQPATPPAPADDTVPFRPVHRPPMALLVICDDGDDEGETLRLRQSRIVIGRAEGDVLIPHDIAVSGRHAELSRRVVDGVPRWFLRDLGSSNGTFVRVARTVLQHGQELILGGRRLRFDVASPTVAEVPEAEGQVAATRKFQVTRPDSGPGLAPASLVEVSEAGDGRRFPIGPPETWIGRDPRQCPIALDDPMVSPRHARIARDGSGRWQIENARSLNGVWFRVAEIAIDRTCHFLCGEQRFSVKIP